MTDADPKSTFRGLPLTPEQDAEVRHYIKKQKQQGAEWDTPELAAMLRDIPSSTKRKQLRNVRRLRSTRRWTRLRQAKSGPRPWKSRR
jgi:hypothetical protein